MRYRILGQLEARTVVDDSPALRRRKSRTLLAVLLLHANETVSTDVLLDALWPESAPTRALGSLQNFVSQLRKALGEGRLETRAPGYRLRVEPDELDVVVFERLVAAARQGPAPQRRERLESALALWRGPPLEEFSYEPFAQAEIARLDELRLTAHEHRIETDLELGRHSEVVGELESLVAAHPLRERLRALLMLALYRSGRQAEALEVYRTGRSLLREELGLEPADELRRLERSILSQSEELAAPALASASASEPPPARRKVVTVLFADVTGSTRLASSLDPEALRDVMSRFFGAMRSVVERHGGTVEKISGDEVMAVFGVPAVHEDDGLRALRAAVEMRDALETVNDELAREHGVGLALRIGVNTGEVVTGDQRATPLVTGEAVNVGKRLQEAASPGDVLLGPMTRALVLAFAELEPVGPLTLRGRPEPLQAHRFARFVSTESVDDRDHGAPLIGRAVELAQLRGAYERAARERVCIATVVLGDAGIGKSRLARELTAGVTREAHVLVGRCVSYGEGATYLPLVDVVRQATREQPLHELFGEDPDAERLVEGLRALLGEVEVPLPANEVALAVRRLLETLAGRRPVVLVLEDLHWAEPTLLDLVEQLVERSQGVPLLVLAVARPDLGQRRPQWLEETTARSVIRLEPLADAEAEQLVTDLGGETVGADLVARVVETAEGNPLFAEQLFLLVREQGPKALASRPPTVEALLASRLDALAPAERAAAERAAVVGRDFRRSELAALAPPEEAALAKQMLDSLTRTGIVRPRRATASTDDAYAFRHVLIRDVAYAAAPKARRAELHERFADWLAEQREAPDEIVGYHLEQAYRYRVELGPARVAARLGADAGERLGRAGVRALARGDAPAALNLLARATQVFPPGDLRRLELTIELAVTERLSGRIADAEARLRAVAEEAAAARNRRLELRALVELKGVQLMSEPEAPREFVALAESALPVFEALGDDRALGRTWFTVGFVRGGFWLQNSEYEAAAERALHHYRRAGWPTATCLQAVAAALFYGPRPAAEALVRIEELLATEATERAGEMHLRLWGAGLHALRGELDGARAAVATATRTFEDLGQPVTVATACGFVAGFTEMLAGEFAVAERILRGSCEVLERRGEWAAVATRASEVANALCGQGRFAEAARWVDTARLHTADDDLGAGFLWRSVLAKVTADAGETDEAEALAREALQLADRTDAVNQRADVRADLAHVLSVAGRPEEAAAAARAAAALYEQKGNVPGAARARAAASRTGVA